MRCRKIGQRLVEGVGVLGGDLGAGHRAERALQAGVLQFGRIVLIEVVGDRLADRIDRAEISHACSRRSSTGGSRPSRRPAVRTDARHPPPGPRPIRSGRARRAPLRLREAWPRFGVHPPHANAVRGIAGIGVKHEVAQNLPLQLFTHPAALVALASARARPLATRGIVPVFTRRSAAVRPAGRIQNSAQVRRTCGDTTAGCGQSAARRRGQPAMLCGRPRNSAPVRLYLRSRR